MDYLENKFDHIMSEISMDRWSKHHEKSIENNNGQADVHFTPVRHGLQDAISHQELKLSSRFYEVLASIQNLIKLPFQIIRAPVKYFIAKPLRFAASFIAPKAKIFKKFDNSLPGVKAITKTAAKAIGYFAGSISILTLGVLVLAANVWPHKKVKLYNNAEFQKKKAEIEQFKKVQHEAHQAYLRAHAYEVEQPDVKQCDQGAEGVPGFHYKALKANDEAIKVAEIADFLAQLVGKDEAKDNGPGMDGDHLVFNFPGKEQKKADVADDKKEDIVDKPESDDEHIGSFFDLSEEEVEDKGEVKDEVEVKETKEEKGFFYQAGMTFAIFFDYYRLIP